MDSLKFHNTLIFLITSPTIRRDSLMCAILNGLFFIGSYYTLEMVVLPLLRLIITFDFEISKDPGKTTSFSEYILSNPTSTSTISAQDQAANFLVNKVFFWLYHTLWLYPIYFLSNIISQMWYQEIVDATYKLLDEPKLKTKVPIPYLTEKVYQAFLTIGLYLQMFAVTFIPALGGPLCFVHVCWLYSLYSFDYKWDKQGRRLLSRLQYFEERWAYFFGFGFPLASLTAFFPWLVAYGLYALTAPAFIMLAITAHPIEHGPNQINNLTGVSNSRQTTSNPSHSNGLRLPIYFFPKIFAENISWICCGTGGISRNNNRDRASSVS